MRRAKWWFFITIVLMLVPSGAYLDPFSGETGSSLQAKVLYSDGDDNDDWDQLMPMGDDDDDDANIILGDDWDDDETLNLGVVAGWNCISGDDWDDSNSLFMGDDWDDDNACYQICYDSLSCLFIIISLP